MEYRWKIKEKGNADDVQRLANELGVPPALANMLVQRGIRTFDDAKKFFRPSLADLHDPFLMKDMDKAVARIEKAIRNKENILVYGDYDVDGTTAVALLYTFLKGFYPSVSFYIPDRYKEGYGISFAGIDHAAETGCSLIIALDCGIKSVEKVAYATEKKIDFIICDHHRPGEKIPGAAAVLDPKRSDCPYPYKELPGCAIGFKLAQAYAQANKIPFEKLEQFLDLAAVSIAADIVPITGENRVLAYHGLKKLNSSPRTGFKTLLELNSVKKELTVSDLVFIIGPRINAAGRIDTGKKSVELLISENENEAMEWGMMINKNNTDRKDLDQTITLEALEMIGNSKEPASKRTTVVYHPKWHKGVVGIVASRLTEKYYRPTIVLTESNGLITGSARSVKDFDVYEAIDACSHLLEQFGGHMAAAGITMKPENLPKFIEKFEEVVSSTIEERMLVPEIEIDEQLNLSDITPKFFSVIRQMAPFGPGNMSPVFLTENVMDKGFARIVGNNHLKLDICNPKNTKESFPSIAFGQGDQLLNVKSKKPFTVCYTIEENVYNGNVSLQLVVKDLKF